MDCDLTLLMCTENSREKKQWRKTLEKNNGEKHWKKTVAKNIGKNSGEKHWGKSGEKY